MNKLAPYWKAAVGFIAPGATLIVAQGGDLTGKEWLVALATCVVTSAAVYAAPKNKPTA
jgi:hypothetical protein